MLRRVSSFGLPVLFCFWAFVATPEVFSQIPANIKSSFTKIELETQKLEDWRSHIEPTDAELKWRKIPWLPTFSEGIAEGAKKKQPVLLWTMNGHPLGCT